MNYKETVEAKRSAMADQLLDFIENNPTAWEAGWYKVGGAPRNGKTDKAYNGLNALWLYLIAEHKGYTDPRWVTYQQAKDLKASVKAGEKSSNVFYWSWYDKKTKKPFDDATVKDMGKDERQKYLDENVRPVLKYYQVFNAAQCQNFPKLDAEQKEMPADERARQNAKIENIISNSAAPVYYDGGNRAYYSPGRDSIHLPEIHRFHTMQDYYATALHEIAHSTGRKERLNRDMSGAFGSVKYAQEELRAELASVFMQLDLDIRVEGKHFENHGAYLQSWLKRASADKKEFFAAVTDAEKISQYVGEHYLHENEVEAALAAAAEENTKEQEQAATKVIVLEPAEAAEYLRGVEINERRKAADNEIYGLIYDWKGLKEENSLYTGKQLKELDAAFVPEDRYDGAIAANKTYMAIRLTGKTPEETDQNVRKFLTGKYNEAGDIEYIEGWYWETVEENFFTGEKNETTLKYIDRLNIPSEDLRMKEEYAIEQRQKKIDKIVYDIVNEGTENTTQGNWIINFDQFGEDEVFVRNYIDEIAEALNKREEVADVIINENGIDTDYFTDYCPNIEAEQAGRELTPLQKAQAEAEQRALSENIAYVVIEWSEKNSSALTSALRNNTVMTFDEADKLLDAMNEAEKARDGYYKTKLHIVTPVESEEGISAGWYNDCRYDIGSEPDGGLIAHIKGFAEYASDGKEISEFADVLESHRTARKEQAGQVDDAEEQTLRRDNLDQSQPAEQAEQAEQAKQAGQAEPAEWYAIELSADQIGNEYEKSVMIRMPQGEYSSFVFFAPKNLVRGGEKDGTKKLSVRSDWEYRLQNDGLQVELNGSELRAAFAGREVGKSAKRVAPRRRNKQRLSDLEANVPDEMKALKNWCVFRTKYNPETERQEKFVISPTDGKWAKSNDPNTWVDFQTALKYAEENDCAGLSFALDGKCGITCIDLDKSISKDGKLTESAEKLTQELADTYAETSVSGNGIHIFVADDILHKTYKNRADLPDGEIEVYDNVRFISMTGNKRSKSNKLTKCPAATTSWLRGKLGRKSAEYDNKPRNIERQSDSDVIERIRRSKRGRDFDTLMSGGAITGDKSRDDMILLNMLAFFSDCDRSQMEAIFRSSGRSVETGGQGQGKSSNYLARSIDKAVSSLKTRISPAALGGAGRSGGRTR